MAEVVAYVGHGLDVTLTVSDATGIMRMRRDRRRLLGEQTIEPDEDRSIMRRFSYPDAYGAVTAATGFAFPWPPDFETFIALPDELLVELENAIYRVNPHWLPGGRASEDPKEPAPDSTEN